MTNETEKVIKETIGKLGNKVSSNVKRQVETAVKKVLDGDLNPREAMGITPAHESALYKHAYNLFQSGQFKKARDIFYFLRSLDNFSYRYAFGEAACHQYLGEYNDAIAVYQYCISLDPSIPTPYFHQYDCFMKLNAHWAAYKALLLTIEWSKLDPSYSELEKRALLELESLKKILKEDRVINQKKEG